MSDTSTPEGTQSTEQQQGEPAELGDAGKKALAEERKRAAVAEKEAKALKARLDEIETANLSELDKAKNRASEAETRLSQIEQTNTRMRVALEAGLPLEDVDRIKGETEDELLADAKSLAARLGKTAATPKPDPSQGARDGEAGTSTGDQFASAIGPLFTT